MEIGALCMHAGQGIRFHRTGQGNNNIKPQARVTMHDHIIQMIFLSSCEVVQVRWPAGSQDLTTHNDARESKSFTKKSCATRLLCCPFRDRGDQVALLPIPVAVIRHRGGDRLPYYQPDQPDQPDK